jgi:hypothetical protein
LGAGTPSKRIAAGRSTNEPARVAIDLHSDAETMPKVAGGQRVISHEAIAPARSLAGDYRLTARMNPTSTRESGIFRIVEEASTGLMFGYSSRIDDPVRLQPGGARKKRAGA